MNRFFLITILIMFSPFGFSQVEKNTNGFYNCFRMAGTRYSIDHRLLIAIAEVESGMSPKAIGLNKRGGKVVSEDVGLMQINSSWFPTLNSMGITRNDLLENPCQNILSAHGYLLRTFQPTVLTGNQLVRIMLDLKGLMHLFA